MIMCECLREAGSYRRQGELKITVSMAMAEEKVSSRLCRFCDQMSPDAIYPAQGVPLNCGRRRN